MTGQFQYAGKEMVLNETIFPFLENGQPVMTKDNVDETGFNGQLFEIIDEDNNGLRRAVVRRTSPHLDKMAQHNPDTGVVVSYRWDDCYLRPDGQILQLPVEVDGNMQTVGRYQKTGGGREKDLYLEKQKGGVKFKWADGAAVAKQLKVSDENARKQEQRRQAMDPANAPQKTAEAFVEAVKLLNSQGLSVAPQPFVGGFKNAEIVDHSKKKG